MSLWVKRGENYNSGGVFSAFHLHGCDLHRLALASLLFIALSCQLTLWICCLFLFFYLLLLFTHDQFIELRYWRPTKLCISLASWWRLLRLFWTRCFLTRFFGPRALTLLALFGCWWGTTAILFLAMLYLDLLLLLGTIVASLSFFLRLVLGSSFRVRLQRGRHEEFLFGRGRIDQVLQILVQSLRISLSQMLIRENTLHYVLLIFFLDESAFDPQAFVRIVFADRVWDFFHPDALLSLF